MGAKGRRTLAIGDIHGCLRALETLAEEVGFGAGDRIVVLGDIVDRGPDTKGVVEFLMALQKRCELVLLKGNHEIMMEVARRDRQPRDQAEPLEQVALDRLPKRWRQCVDGLTQRRFQRPQLFGHA